MLNNVYKALRSIFSCKKGDCTNDGVKSSQGASEEGESTFNETNIPDNVSEPVISFVKCFRDNPKRFRLVSEWYRVQSSMNVTQTYFLVDKVTDIKYKYSYYHLADMFTDHIDIKDILIEEEIDYLISILREVFEARKTRYNQILEQRRQRTQTRLREKLTKIYKGDENASN